MTGGEIRTDPSWASVYPQVTWQLMRAYGDRQLAAQQWDALLRMLRLEAEDARTCSPAESPRTVFAPNTSSFQQKECGRSCPCLMQLHCEIKQSNVSG
jgi:hypothetical protein